LKGCTSAIALCFLPALHRCSITTASPL
jgi:hypothetical protein